MPYPGSRRMKNPKSVYHRLCRFDIFVSRKVIRKSPTAMSRFALDGQSMTPRMPVPPGYLLMQSFIRTKNHINWR